MKYGETFLKLTYEVATVVFLKANGDARTMLATRNEATAAINHGPVNGILAGHDKKCNINNGTLAVIDLILGEPRSFNMDRLVSIQFHGVIDTQQKMDAIYAEFKEFRDEYEKNKPQKLSMDLLTDL